MNTFARVALVGAEFAPAGAGPALRYPFICKTNGKKTMACKHCEGLSPEAARRSRELVPSGSREWERLRSVICVRCGTVLPPVTPSETLLEKLTQLARFGLTDGGTPILELTSGARRSRT